MFKNGLSLAALQLFSYAVPFLLLPYLSRTLGVAGFGEVALVWAIDVVVKYNDCKARHGAIVKALN